MFRKYFFKTDYLLLLVLYTIGLIEREIFKISLKFYDTLNWMNAPP